MRRVMRRRFSRIFLTKRLSILRRTGRRAKTRFAITLTRSVTAAWLRLCSAFSTKTPGYDFRLNEGTRAIEGSAAARGGLYSGATMQALQNYGQDYATNAYENWLNRVGGLTQMGQQTGVHGG